MRPAFSVIFFTSLSGAGYGLWIWSALLFLTQRQGIPGFTSYCLILGFVLVSAGLLSSLGHLGQPQRAWRALSQWRSSWLSREGVAALASFVPAIVLIFGRYEAIDPVVQWLAALMLLLLSLSTLVCTAMIYASLRTIVLWHNWRVVPVYLLLGLYSGAWIALSLAGDERELMPISLRGMIWLGLAVALLKIGYWAQSDNARLPATRKFLGLKTDRHVSNFEQPHTAQNYLSRELMFALARRWSRSLRFLVQLLLLLGPLTIYACERWLGWSVPGAFPIAAIGVLLGILIERWLFFAEARHVISAYYQVDGPVKS